MIAIGKIGGNSGTQAIKSNQFSGNDSVSKNIQRQIANKQKELQDLSSKEDMTIEDKMKRRQEIMQEISDLNNQLRQHQIDQRKEEQQRKKSSMDDMQSQSEGTGLSQESMQAIVAADSSMKQARVQGSVATEMNGRAGVLEGEIKQDKSRGTSTKKKEAELADVQEKMQAAAGSQMSILANANEVMKDASKADETSENKKEKAEDKQNVDESTEVETLQTINYTPVDIRL